MWKQGGHQEELPRALLEGALVGVVFLVTRAAGWASHAVVAAAVLIGLLPVVAWRASPDGCARRVAAGFWLLPGLTIAAACVLSASRLEGNGVERMLLAAPPPIAWLVAASLGGLIRAAPRRNESERAASRWPTACAAGGVGLAGLLVGVVVRDVGRPSIAELRASPGQVATSLAPSENACAARSDLPRCRYLVQDSVCVGVEATYIGRSAWSGWSEEPLPSVYSLCPLVAVRRVAKSQHVTVEIRNDLPPPPRRLDTSRPDESLLVVSGSDVAPTLSATILGETAAPAGWKLLGAAGLAALVAMGFASRALARAQMRNDNPDGDPYRRMEAINHFGGSDPLPRSLRYRYGLLLALLASAPLAASAWVGGEPAGPRFSAPITVKAVIPTDSATPGAALVYIDAPAGSDCFFGQFNIGPAPRWGVEVEAGNRVLTLAGRDMPFSVPSGEKRVIRIDR